MNKDRFEMLAKKYIQRDGIKDLLSSLDRSDFYTAPASTRFHDSHEGGLVEHSLKVFEALKDDVEAYDLGFDMETVAIVSLFHDICKIGFYKTEMRNTKENGKWIKVPYYTVEDKLPIGHSEKSVILLQQFMKLKVDEILAINAHMGGWDKRDFIVSNTFEECPLAVYLHMADLKATYLK